MASSSRTARNSVKALLSQQPFRFSFVQAVRLLERIRLQQGHSGQALGYDAHPSSEWVRLVGKPGLSFPASEVAGLADATSKETGPNPSRPVLAIALMGLYGASGALPYFDTQRIIDQGVRDNAEKDLLDLFNHRILSYYYRALTKYRVSIAFERYLTDDSKDENLVTTALLSLAGMGTPGLLRRMEFADELTIEFCQYFSQQPKNEISLNRMLQAFLNLPIRIRQFQGQWLQLAAEDTSIMPTREMPLGQNCMLGNDFILGDRVWDIQSKFCVQIGPLRRQEFENLLPGSSQLNQMAQLIRLYVGNQLDFEFQLELLAQDVPELILGSNASRLGLNTWLISVPPGTNKRDAVFVATGQPTR